MNIKKNVLKRSVDDLYFNTCLNNSNKKPKNISVNNKNLIKNDKNSSFIIIKPNIFINKNNKKHNVGSDSASDSESEAESESEDESEAESTNSKLKNNKKNQLIKFEDVKYYDSDESTDSENELDTTNPKKISLNILKKIKRHNKKDNFQTILKKFNEKIKKMNTKYNEYLKNPLKYKKLREFKNNINECKNLSNLLDIDLNQYKSKFNFNFFSKKYYNDINKQENKKEKKDKSFENLLLDNLKNCKSQHEDNSKLDIEFSNLYNRDTKNYQSSFKYFKLLDNDTKQDYILELKKITNSIDFSDDRPYYLKILSMDLIESNKKIILQKIHQFENSSKCNTDGKLKNWINKIMNVPFGIYIKPLIRKHDNIFKIRNYLSNVRKELDKNIYGHSVSKEQIIKILAHTITNPAEGGNIFALVGPPGVGKTALIQDGIAGALSRPFSFISLGGSSDACFLEGHEYTYEGSNHGRIVEILQQSKCMNPVIYFDELDKVSETPKGNEIINVLMHLTDQTQNSHFNDKYFGGVAFDLSKVIFIFSFNNEYKISKILKDRMKIIRVKGYKLIDKIKIANNYLIPKLIKQVGMEYLKVNFNDSVIEYLIENYTNEGGVRKLKELLNDILLEVNLRRFESNKIMNQIIKSPLTITEEMIEKDLFKNKNKIIHIKINDKPLIGQVNGLWANDFGIGGLIPIESCWVPSSDKLKLKLTGMQGDVMKESMNVARSVAWRILPESIKSSLNEKWKLFVDSGIHIHCPDGSTPKDGPSAGGAITTCLISLLSGTKVNNQIAMTGEINLKGNITAIGGLEEKIFGAKKADVKLVLYPKENLNDMEQIKEKFTNLFDENFKVKSVENIWDILNEVITEPLEWIRFN
jgi:endopeptidase La